jgi:hypothetical protein
MTIVRMLMNPIFSAAAAVPVIAKTIAMARMPVMVKVFFILSFSLKVIGE